MTARARSASPSTAAASSRKPARLDRPRDLGRPRRRQVDHGLRELRPRLDDHRRARLRHRRRPRPALAFLSGRLDRRLHRPPPPRLLAGAHVAPADRRDAASSGRPNSAAIRPPCVRALSPAHSRAHAGGSRGDVCGLDPLAQILPGADSAAGDVDHRIEALSLQHRHHQAASFAPLADRRQAAASRVTSSRRRATRLGDVKGAWDMALGELATPHARREPARGSLSPSSSASSVRVDQLDSLHRALLGAPGAHPAPEQAPRTSCPPPPAARRRPARSHRKRRHDHIGVGVDHLCDLRRVSGVVAEALIDPGDVGLVELLVGAGVERDGTFGDGGLERAAA